MSCGRAVCGNGKCVAWIALEHTDCCASSTLEELDRDIGVERREAQQCELWCALTVLYVCLEVARSEEDEPTKNWYRAEFSESDRFFWPGQVLTVAVRLEPNL